MHPFKCSFILKVIYKVNENEKEKERTSVYNRHSLGKHGNILAMSVNSSWSLSYLITEAYSLWI